MPPHPLWVQEKVSPLCSSEVSMAFESDSENKPSEGGTTSHCPKIALRSSVAA